MAANVFAVWLRETRSEKKLSQAEVARRVARHLDIDYPREKIHWLERGTPETPPADLVQAVCHALAVPLDEGLRALGFDRVQPKVALHPDLLANLAGVPWEAQGDLARFITAMLASSRSPHGETGQDPLASGLKLVAESGPEYSERVGTAYGGGSEGTGPGDTGATKGEAGVFGDIREHIQPKAADVGDAQRGRGRRSPRN